jgi:predicted N-formylglutamate amidohydrolase
LRDLGLPAAAFERHIAWDIGAADVTRRLAELFGAPAVLSRFSRLVIDPNRGTDDPTLVMRLSDGAVIPGNARADAAEIGRRRRLYWQPYRDAIARSLDSMIAAGTVPAIVSIHSFTPVWKGQARDWQAAILWDRDDRIARPAIEALRGQGLTVGDNEPYDGALEGDTLFALGTRRGIAHVLIELRQDLIGTQEGARTWAARLAGVLRPVLDRPDTHMIRHYGSRAGTRNRENEP